MEDASVQKLQEMEAKLDAILVSVEKTRRHFQVTMWITILFLVLPLIGMAFVVPMFLNSYLGALTSDPSSSSLDQTQLDLLNDFLQ